MNYLFTLLFVLPVFSFCQKIEDPIVLPRDSVTQEIIYTGVVKVDSVSATDLYSRAKLFVADAYRSSKDVTQLNDDATKTILIKPVVQVRFGRLGTAAYSGFVSYQLKMEIKDNKYRYRIEGFAYYDPSDISGRRFNLSEPKPKGLPNKVWQGSLVQMDTNINAIIETMKKQMQTKQSDF